ncbi:MAG: PIN domain-containing protein [Chitinophagaceae bacterium]|nr:PIN domain-containing protein [Anaerolineae bacterium]
MKINQALENVKILGVDSSPLIYFIERSPRYIDLMRVIVKRIDEGTIEALTSVITLTEVLVQPIKFNNVTIEQSYRQILSGSRNFTLKAITYDIAEQAARLRAKYNLKTPDALQVAASLDGGCDAFLTNDLGLKRVDEIQILVLDELEIDPSTNT